jgi:hypothetical protein
MGVTAGLWVVPADEFVPRDGGSVTPRLTKDGAWFDLDKAWAEFDDLLREMPAPLDRAIRGDLWPEGSLYEDNGREDATWLGFVTPKTVAEIAQALDHIEADEVVELMEGAGLSRAGDEFDRRYYAEYFVQLKEAYRTAAREGAGLGVLLC